MAMTEQVRSAIASLRACGFKRNEFSVRVEILRRVRCDDGTYRPEYGEAHIAFYCPNGRILDLSSELEKRFTVTYILSNQIIRYILVEIGKPGKHFMDLDEMARRGER